jgi:hypothetical protein
VFEIEPVGHVDPAKLLLGVSPNRRTAAKTLAITNPKRLLTVFSFTSNGLWNC